MIYICSQCGSQIPDDSDFCYTCGCMKSKALKMDDNGLVSEGVCHSCGAEVSPGDAFCGSCGAALVQLPPRVKVKKYGQVALLLAVLPGMFFIFGLGHFVLKSWSRGLMFLAMSAILWYISPPGYLPSENIYIFVVQIGVYMYQAVDVMRSSFVVEGR